MNTLGKTKDTNTDETYRQFIINCLGENDRGKYFLVTSFGEDFNVPKDTRALTSGSNNKDDKFVFGFLNKVKINNLNPGDKAIFSTSEDGLEIKSQIVLRNTGDIEIENTRDLIATIDRDLIATIDRDLIAESERDVIITAGRYIELNGNADFIAGFSDLKSGFDQLKTDFNNLVTAYNAHMHPTAATGPPSPPTIPGTSSTASIDSSKKDNLKIE